MKRNLSIEQTGRKFWVMKIDGVEVASGTLEQIKLQMEIFALAVTSGLVPQ